MKIISYICITNESLTLIKYKWQIKKYLVQKQKITILIQSVTPKVEKNLNMTKLSHMIIQRLY